jgi:hypothetical protein
VRLFIVIFPKALCCAKATTSCEEYDRAGSVFAVNFGDELMDETSEHPAHCWISFFCPLISVQSSKRNRNEDGSADHSVLSRQLIWR